MNLENLRVEELTTVENKEIEGGCERCYWLGVWVGSGFSPVTALMGLMS